MRPVYRLGSGCGLPPGSRRPAKLKKDPTSGDGLLLQMVRNPDILATIATRPDRPFSVGFAAETEHLLDYAARKLKDKTST